MNTDHRRLLMQKENFLSASLCHRLVIQTPETAYSPAGVAKYGEIVVDKSARKAVWAALDDSLLDQLAPIFSKQMAAMVSYFNVRLSRFQEPQLISYSKGDFHRPHIDSKADPNDPSQSQIACLVYLNDTIDSELGGFRGGELVVHELSQERAGGVRRTHIVPEKGKMVAFRSSLCHEVLPVTWGKRYVLATWYF